MQVDKAAEMAMGGGVAAKAPVRIGKTVGTHYKMEAFNPAGELKWVEEFDNLVVNDGLDDSLDKHFKGSGYTAAWYVGLTDGTPTPAPGDDQAGHAGWVEVVAYDEAVRQTLTLGAVSAQSVDNSANKATFTIATNTAPTKPPSPLPRTTPSSAGLSSVPPIPEVELSIPCTAWARSPQRTRRSTTTTRWQ
jgi:hypothetical protein